MALIDSRGRLWGRVNLIDLAVGVLLVGLIPLAYAAFLLFRQPEPTIRSVSPAQLPAKPSRVRIQGEKLRPFLRVFFNDQQGTTFALIDEQTADVEVPALPPGRYDVILYDVAREVSRLPGALTVDPPPVLDDGARILVWGTFLALQDATANDLKPGQELSVAGGGQVAVVDRGLAIPDARMIDFPEPIETPLTTGVRVAALLRANCRFTANNRCQLGGVDVFPKVQFVMTGATNTAMRFEVGRITADGPTRLVQIRATFVVPGESLSTVRVGDRAAPDQILSDRIPTLAALGSTRRAAVTMVPPSSRLPGQTDMPISFSESMLLVDATVRVRADVTSGGLFHRNQSIRVGSPYLFETDRYVLRGWIRAVDVIEDDDGGR